jgi:HEAT repeat protein
MFKLAWLAPLLCLPAAVTVVRGQDPESSVPDLIVQLKSDDVNTRRDAAYEINRLGRKAKEAVAALTDALDDGDPQVWWRSASALAKIGADAKPAIPKLVAGLQVGGQRQYRFAYALGKIGPEAIPALLETLKSEQPNARAGAAKALGWMGAKVEPAGGPLIQILRDKEAGARELASEALGEIGAGVVPLLTQALGDHSPEVRSGAALALGRIGPEAKPAVLALSSAVMDKEAAVRASAVAALGSLGPAAKTVIPSIVAGITDNQDAVRRAAVEALARTRPHSTNAISALIELLEHENQEVAVSSARALGRMGPVAKEAVPSMIAAIKRIGMVPGDETFADAFRRLVPSAIPLLIKALEDDRKQVKILTCQCLRQFGPRAKSALPALRELLQVEDEPVRTAAKSAIARIAD